jgi:hypothetical protein
MVGMTRKVGRTMNKKELKAKWESVKQWCKDHKTELLVILGNGIAGGVIAGVSSSNGYKKGWNDALDKCEEHMDKQCAWTTPLTNVTPRDFMDDDAIKRTYENKEDGAVDKLDKPIKEIQFWFD